MSPIPSDPPRVMARARQRGAALVTSLLLLLVLTIIGVTAMQMTRLQERMAGGARDLNLALQGSEAGLRNGETMVQARTSRPDTCIATPCAFWQLGALVQPQNQNQAWWTTNGIEFERNPATPTPNEIAQLKRDPQFVVESVGFVSDTLTIGQGAPVGRDFYQVSGRSSGGSGNANTVLRTTYARRF
jgi:type IV pilus assembly protein PilX